MWFTPKPLAASEPVFAVINGETVTEPEFQSFLARFAKSKFYHRVPDGGLGAVRAEAAEALIDRRLLAQEAKRRGVAGDAAAVARQLASYEERYRDTEAWTRVRRDRPRLRAALLEHSRVEALERQVRQVDDPGDEALEAFYRNNIGLFTEPARAELQVILIGVQPWESAEVWEQARLKAAHLAEEIAAGASFAEVARRHSTHISAEKGGALGFVHGGMLSTPAQEAVDRLGPGAVSPPVRVLEGYTLFRLIDRRLPRVREFADVRERALKLYQREESEIRWTGFLAGLRASAEISVPGDTGTAQSE